MEMIPKTNPNLSSGYYSLIAKALAMNKYKNGALTHFNLKYALATNVLEAFIGYMYVSDREHEEWYGDSKVARDMTHDQLVKKLYFGLTYLNLGGSAMKEQNFRLKNYEVLNNPEWPRIMRVLAESGLTCLNLDKCQIQPKGVELWSVALGNNPIQKVTNLKILNLSNN